ncbi:MAG: ROK family protein [Propionibacteriaceae bacterium]|nr:ROK family protein [Micropruina sp.]HBX80258.1 sugar kinase [Propionibacteriaceae bacterium]HBY23833.1 sugar kinase [Propionibacteriaceae bacterium]
MEEFQRLLPRAPGVGEVFQLLRAEPRTRAQLVAITGQARSTIAARLDSLSDAGLIGQIGERASAMGRPAASFYFRSDAGAVLAIDIGAQHVRVAVTDLAVNILAERHLDLSVSRGPHLVLNEVIDTGRALLAEAGIDATHLKGVGIGIPGPVNHKSGRPSSPPIMPGWDGFDIIGSLRAAFDVPIYVDNDANIMAIGEHALALRDVSDLLFIKFGTGVGAGVILDGQIRRGAQGSSGDIGHVRVPGGPPNPCHCGGTGCLEAVIGVPALLDQLASAGVRAESGADIVNLVRAGDKVALQVLRDAGRTAGDVLAGAVSLLNPSVIAVGGILAEVPEQLIAGIRESVYAKSLPLATQDLLIAPSLAGARAGIIGASSLVCDEVLSPAAVETLVESLDAREGGS